MSLIHTGMSTCVIVHILFRWPHWSAFMGVASLSCIKEDQNLTVDIMVLWLSESDLSALSSEMFREP